MIETAPLPTRRSWFLTIAVIGFIVVAGFSGYLQVKKNRLENIVANLQQQKQDAEKPKPTKENLTAKELDSAVEIQKMLQTIEEKQLKWSKIIEKIENIIPKENDEPIAIFNSYTGSEDGKIAASATTRPSATDPFADIAKLLQTFGNDPALSRVFIPSINKSVLPDGSAALSFSINFEYIKPKL